ncbi:lysyl oxidase homolog 2B, partial [Notothenia coriiceps]|uniref:Lysyl oxidase homolog 2B n=1 Tax=Notothenia coriiceps TaxID=8208 RepID=A0A6I9P5P6_9TELE
MSAVRGDESWFEGPPGNVFLGPPQTLEPPLALRLSGGRNPFEGRVEVLMERNGSLVWGTVCSEGWGTMEAMVVCRTLGLGFASNAFQETWYWPGDVSADSVVMSGVRCSGTEMSLNHCLHHGAHLSCSKGGGRNAAGVSCSE